MNHELESLRTLVGEGLTLMRDRAPLRQRTPVFSGNSLLPLLLWLTDKFQGLHF